MTLREICETLEVSRRANHAPNQVVRNVLEQQVQKLVKEQMKMDDLIKEANQIIDRLKNENDK